MKSFLFTFALILASLDSILQVNGNDNLRTTSFNLPKHGNKQVLFSSRQTDLTPEFKEPETEAEIASIRDFLLLQIQTDEFKEKQKAKINQTIQWDKEPVPSIPEKEVVQDQEKPEILPIPQPLVQEAVVEEKPPQNGEESKEPPVFPGQIPDIASIIAAMPQPPKPEVNIPSKPEINTPQTAAEEDKEPPKPPAVPDIASIIAAMPQPPKPEINIPAKPEILFPVAPGKPKVENQNFEVKKGPAKPKPEKPAKNPKPPKPEAEKPPKPQGNSPAKPEKPPKPDRPSKHPKPERPSKNPNPERPSKHPKPQGNSPVKPEKPSRHPRPEKPSKNPKPPKPEEAEKPPKPQENSPTKPEKPELSIPSKPEKPEISIPSKPEKPEINIPAKPEISLPVQVSETDEFQKYQMSSAERTKKVDELLSFLPPPSQSTGTGFDLTPELGVEQQQEPGSLELDPKPEINAQTANTNQHKVEVNKPEKDTVSYSSSSQSGQNGTVTSHGTYISQTGNNAPQTIQWTQQGQDKPIISASNLPVPSSSSQTTQNQPKPPQIFLNLNPFANNWANLGANQQQSTGTGSTLPQTQPQFSHAQYLLPYIYNLLLQQQQQQQQPNKPQQETPTTDSDQNSPQMIQIPILLTPGNSKNQQQQQQQSPSIVLTINAENADRNTQNKGQGQDEKTPPFGPIVIPVNLASSGEDGISIPDTLPNLLASFMPSCRDKCLREGKIGGALDIPCLSLNCRCPVPWNSNMLPLTKSTSTGLCDPTKCDNFCRKPARIIDSEIVDIYGLSYNQGGLCVPVILGATTVNRCECLCMSGDKNLPRN